MFRALSLILALAVAMQVTASRIDRQSRGKSKHAKSMQVESLENADSQEGYSTISQSARNSTVSEVRDWAACTRLMDLFPNFKTVPYSIVGTRRTSDGDYQKNLAPLDLTVAVVDPAGRSYMDSQEPEEAGGSSGSLYRRIEMWRFPDDVVRTCKLVSQAKLHKYTDGKIKTNVIHVLSPDLWRYAEKVPWQEDEVDFSNDMAQTLMAVKSSYKNVFKEFLKSDVKTLRLLPISGGHFAGPYKSGHSQLTYVAIVRAVDDLLWDISKAEQAKLKDANIEMCIFEENEFDEYNQAALNACY